MSKFIGCKKKVECPDGIERYFKITSKETHRLPDGSLVYRGSVQLFRENITVSGDAVSVGCGRYVFVPDKNLKNGGAFNNE